VPGLFAMTKSELIPLLLLAISSNGDNVAVGVAYGLGRIDVPLASNCLIAVVTGTCTLLAMALGRGIGSVMAPKLAGGIGGLLIVAIGIWVIVGAVRARNGRNSSRPAVPSQGGDSLGLFPQLLRLMENPVDADRNFSRRIEMKESWLLAIALSLNNTVNGVAAGMVGMNPWTLTLFVMLFSVLTLSAGLTAGRQASERWVGNFSGVLSGLLLIAVGIYEIRI
jgi:putative sporulation protein YtaF